MTAVDCQRDRDGSVNVGMSDSDSSTIVESGPLRGVAPGRALETSFKREQGGPVFTQFPFGRSQIPRSRWVPRLPD
jgi:hypothetical protein